MSASSDPKFVIFRDVRDGCRWRLRSASGQTVETSERGRGDKGECVRDVYRVRADRYPHANVRDATAR
jgi:uncharacterized protein YegP (UPF0339 family)